MDRQPVTTEAVFQASAEYIRLIDACARRNKVNAARSHWEALVRRLALQRKDDEGASIQQTVAIAAE